jgi:hypothetical protein
LRAIAKQSSVRQRFLDCFVATAPRNDGEKPYGRGIFGLQLPEAHFGVDDAVTIELFLVAVVGGGFGFGVLAVWGAGVDAPVVPGVGEVDLAMAVTGPGFGGAGGGMEAWVVAPPTTGGGFATPPILFCCGLAPPSVLCASADEMPATVKPSAPASINPRIALLFMMGLAYLRRKSPLVIVVLSRAFAKASRNNCSARSQTTA